MELRVSRLENDTQSIYDLMSEVRFTQQEHSQRLDKVDQRLDKVDRRLDKVDRRLDKVDQRFDQVDQRFDQVDQRFDKIELTLVEVVRRLPNPS